MEAAEEGRIRAVVPASLVLDVRGLRSGTVVEPVVDARRFVVVGGGTGRSRAVAVEVTGGLVTVLARAVVVFRGTVVVAGVVRAAREERRGARVVETTGVGPPAFLRGALTGAPTTFLATAGVASGGGMSPSVDSVGTGVVDDPTKENEGAVRLWHNKSGSMSVAFAKLRQTASWRRKLQSTATLASNLVPVAQELLCPYEPMQDPTNAAEAEYRTQLEAREYQRR